MLKKIVLGLLLFFLFSVSLATVLKKQDSHYLKFSEQSSRVTATPTETASKTMSFSDSNYKVSWVVVRRPDKINLHSNLEKRLTAKEAKSELGCHYLISGGFYNQEGNHIGLFISDFGKESYFQESSLFNGFFAITKEGKAIISSLPPASARISLQAGPILIKEGKAQKLVSDNNTKARRLVVTTNRFGDVIFLAIFDENSTVLGPTLAELPEILKEIEENTSLGFSEALNLDGGAHSAFISDSLTLTELSTIGSYFCIKFDSK